MAKNNCTYLEVYENWTLLYTINCTPPAQHAKWIKLCSPLWIVIFHPGNIRVIRRYVIPARIIAKKKNLSVTRSRKNGFGWRTYFLTYSFTNGYPLMRICRGRSVPVTSPWKSITEATSDVTPNTRLWHDPA